MMANNYSVKVGYSDYGDIYLKRIQDRIMIKRYTPLDDDYMRDYCDDNVDIYNEWQEDVANGNTEEGYDSYRENYEYSFDSFFDYDTDNDEYYDGSSDDTTWDYFDTKGYTKEQTIERVLGVLNSDYNYGNFERANIDEATFMTMVGRVYDDCITYAKELEESRKPHWNVFNYYK